MDAKNNLAAGIFIGGISTGSAFIQGISIKSALVWDVDVNVQLFCIYK